MTEDLAKEGFVGMGGEVVEGLLQGEEGEAVVVDALGEVVQGQGGRDGGGEEIVLELGLEGGDLSIVMSEDKVNIEDLKQHL